MCPIGFEVPTGTRIKKTTPTFLFRKIPPPLLNKKVGMNALRAKHGIALLKLKSLFLG